MSSKIGLFKSHGDGRPSIDSFKKYGTNVVMEPSVMVFHPENIELNDNLYIGHQTILKGYYNNLMSIGPNTWIGQQSFLHSAGGLTIGANVGIGIGVKIITSLHTEEGTDLPIIASKISFAPVQIADDCDIGVGAIILPGVSIGRGVQVGAGAVVTHSLESFVVAAGVPARVLRYRDQ